MPAGVLSQLTRSQSSVLSFSLATSMFEQLRTKAGQVEYLPLLIHSSFILLVPVETGSVLCETQSVYVHGKGLSV